MADFITAARAGDIPTLRDFTHAGIAVNYQNQAGESAMFVAATHGREHVCLWLLEKGADVNLASTCTGETPLHGAADRGHGDCVFLLLRRGAKVNAQTKSNWDTPLHMAAYRGHDKICRQLLEAGADVWLKNGQQHRPIDQAQQGRHTAIFQMLRTKDEVFRRREPSRGHTDPLYRKGTPGVKKPAITTNGHTTEIPLRSIIFSVEQLPVTRSYSAPVSSNSSPKNQSPTQPARGSPMQPARRPPPLDLVSTQGPPGSRPMESLVSGRYRSSRSPVESLDLTPTDVLLSTASIRLPPEGAFEGTAAEEYAHEVGDELDSCLRLSINNGGTDMTPMPDFDSHPITYENQIPPLSSNTETDRPDARPQHMLTLTESEPQPVNPCDRISQRYAMGPLRQNIPANGISQCPENCRALKLMKKVDHLEKYGEALQIALTQKIDEMDALLAERRRGSEQAAEVEELRREVQRQARRMETTEASLAGATRQLRALTGSTHDLRQALEAQIQRTENTVRELRAAREKVSRLQSTNGHLQEEIGKLQGTGTEAGGQQQGGGGKFVSYIEDNREYRLVARGSTSAESDSPERTNDTTETKQNRSGEELLYSALLPVFKPDQENPLLERLLISLRRTVEDGLRRDLLPALDVAGTVWTPNVHFQWVDREVSSRHSVDGTDSFTTLILYESNIYELWVYPSDVDMKAGTKNLLPLHLFHDNVISVRHTYRVPGSYTRKIWQDLNIRTIANFNESVCAVCEAPATNLKDFLFSYARKAILSEEFILQLLSELFFAIMEVEERTNGVWICSLEDIYLDSSLKVKLGGTFHSKSKVHQNQDTMQSLASMVGMLLPVKFSNGRSSKSTLGLKLVLDAWKLGCLNIKELFITTGCIITGIPADRVTSIGECRIWCQSKLMSIIVQERREPKRSFSCPTVLHPNSEMSDRKTELEKRLLVYASPEDIYNAILFLRQ